MKRLIATASTVLVIFGGAAACGTSSTSNDAGGSKKEAAAAAEQGPPTLKVGKTVQVTPTDYSDDFQDTSKGSADVTLKSVQEYNENDLKNDVVSNHLDADEEQVVVNLNVANTGDSPVRMTSFSTANWTGKDGQVSEVKMGVFADDKYTTQDLGEADDLQPGQHIEGGTVLIINGSQPGTLHFEDEAGNALFNVTTKGVA